MSSPQISTLVGLKEFAKILRWDKAKLSTKLSRQQKGQRVRSSLPEPIQILAATPFCSFFAFLFLVTSLYNQTINHSVMLFTKCNELRSL